MFRCFSINIDVFSDGSGEKGIVGVRGLQLELKCE